MCLPRAASRAASVVLLAVLGVLRAQGGDAPRPIDLGYEAWSKGDWDAALARFDEAVRHEPRNPTAYYGRGLAHGMKEKLDLAILDLTKAIELDPTEARAYRGRGAIYLAKGDYGRAIADCDEAIRRNLRDASTFNNRGYARLSQGEVEKALSDFTEAIRLDPKVSRTFVNRALAWRERRAYDRALADLDEAIAVDRKNVWAFRLRCEVYWRMGESDKAIVAVSEAVRLDPTSPDVYRQRASVYTLRGESDRALADFTEAIRLDPSNAEGYAARGGCYARRRRYEMAFADFDEAVRLNPRSPCLYEARGTLRIECGDYEHGVADIEHAIRVNPADPAAKYEASPKRTISSADLEHGERQVRQMLRDRPAMSTHGEKAAVLYRWAARKFAGEDVGRRVFWDASEPPPYTTAANYLPEKGAGFIRVGRRYVTGVDNGTERSFEELWRDAVFELCNIVNWGRFRALETEARAGKVSREAFVAKIVECESCAAESTRAFYIRVFMPWARENSIPSHPGSWYLAQRSDPSESLLHLATQNDACWRAYERWYDMIILQSLVERGENQKAFDAATDMQKRAETPEERATLYRFCGYCLLRLNKPFQSLAAFSEAVRLCPRNADGYLGRASVYSMLHNTDQAIADYSEAIRLKPSDSEAYLLRGKAYESTHDKERANADFAMAKGLTRLRAQRDQETPGEGAEFRGRTIEPSPMLMRDGIRVAPQQ